MGRKVLAEDLRELPRACFRSRFDVAASAGFSLLLKVTNHAASVFSEDRTRATFHASTDARSK